MPSMNKIILFTLAPLFLIGCATSQKTTFSETAIKVPVQSAYLVNKGGRSSDMDQHLQKGLQAQGLVVRTGPDVVKSNDADIIVKYSDSWRWDVAMYIKELHINVSEAKTGNILATGNWENSALHGFPNAEEVVNGVLKEIFQKIKVARSEK